MNSTPNQVLDWFRARDIAPTAKHLVKSQTSRTPLFAETHPQTQLRLVTARVSSRSDAEPATAASTNLSAHAV
jgi:hypothetical protein